MSLQAENCRNPEQLLCTSGTRRILLEEPDTEAWEAQLVFLLLLQPGAGPRSSENTAQNTGSLVEVSVHELMSSVWAARCRDGSEALRLILGRECCKSSMDDRIWGETAA